MPTSEGTNIVQRFHCHRVRNHVASIYHILWCPARACRCNRSSCPITRGRFAWSLSIDCRKSTRQRVKRAINLRRL